MAKKASAKTSAKSSKTNVDRAKAVAAARKSQPQKKKRLSFKEYFRGIKLEMKKVVWPTKEELGSYTVVVLVVCAFFSIGFWLIDSGFLALLRAVFNINL